MSDFVNKEDIGLVANELNNYELMALTTDEGKNLNFLDSDVDRKDNDNVVLINTQTDDVRVSLSEGEAENSIESTILLLENPIENTQVNNSQNKCFAECVEKCEMTYPNLPEESKECKIKSCLCDENDVAAQPNQVESQTNHKFYLATAFMNFLVFLSVLFLSASLIILCAILLKKKDSNTNTNNSDYDTLDVNKIDTDKVLDEKLLYSQLFDSNYELMTTEDIEEDIVKITDI